MINNFFYNCVNSKDIRKYLKELDYQFSPLEAAWLVWQCNTKTLAEKNDLWNLIIKYMPDCAVPKSPAYAEDDDPEYTLHELLKERMRLQEEYIRELPRKTKDCVYEYTLFRAGSPQKLCGDNVLYSSYEKCLDAAGAFCERHPEDAPVNKLRIQKNRLNKVGSYMFEDLGPDGELLDILAMDYYDPGDSRNDTYVMLAAFADHMNFAFPAPFKTGDILWIPNDTVSADPLVLKSVDMRPDRVLLSDDPAGLAGYSNGLYLQGVVMTGSDVCDIRFGTWYMDMEYYPEELLTGEKLVLKHLSDYYKSNIDLLHCLRRCRDISDRFRDASQLYWLIKEVAENAGRDAK